MTTRSRLLFMLVPSIIAFLILLGLFFYTQADILTFLLASIPFLLLMVIVLVVSDSISKPFQKLNLAALDIAAGHYEPIYVEGPKEVAELANTLNTMSECFSENISRLRESSLIRERMYGEYECALLLQHYMLQKVVENFNHPFMRMRLISVQAAQALKGLLLKIYKEEGGNLRLTLLEAKEPGFAHLFQLNQEAGLPLEELTEESYIECRFQQNPSCLFYRTQKLTAPLVWSIKSQQFIKNHLENTPLQNKDMIFLYNSGLLDQFETEERLEKWFGKVLRHFAEDGLDAISTMLANELNFLAKKHLLKRNCQIIALQIHD